MSTSKAVVLNVSEWMPSENKYMQPKINDKGGRSINLISKQTNRGLHISTPLMMTWGIGDNFVDEHGEATGKYSISMNFPNEDYSNLAADAFLTKLKQFENQILDDAVKYAETWWGEEMSREVLKHTCFPFLKYSKSKDSKKIDYSKPPSIRAKVPNYNGKWGVEIYDTKSNLIFPCANETITPMDLVPKLSQVACVLQCGGIWIGGKGWGLTWKLVQCVVKPREVISVFGKCHIQLSDADRETLESQPQAEEEEETVKVTSTLVDDSDDEEPQVAKEVVKVEPVKEVVKVEPVKEVVKVESVTEVVEVEPVEVEPVEAKVEAPKKKVIKKKV